MPRLDRTDDERKRRKWQSAWASWDWWAHWARDMGWSWRPQEPPAFPRYLAGYAEDPRFGSDGGDAFGDTSPK